jgi:hypothetical protein
MEIKKKLKVELPYAYGLDVAWVYVNSHNDTPKELVPKFWN